MARKKQKQKPRPTKCERCGKHADALRECSECGRIVCEDCNTSFGMCFACWREFDNDDEDDSDGMWHDDYFEDYDADDFDDVGHPLESGFLGHGQE